MSLDSKKRESSLDLDMEQALDILHKVAPYVSEQELHEAMTELVDSLIDKCGTLGEDDFQHCLVDWKRSKGSKGVSRKGVPFVVPLRTLPDDDETNKYSSTRAVAKHRKHSSSSCSTSSTSSASSVSSSISSVSSNSFISSTMSLSSASSPVSQTLAIPSPSSLRASPYSQMLKAYTSNASPRRVRFTDKFLGWWKRF